MNDQVLGEAMQELHGYNPTRESSGPELCINDGKPVTVMAFRGTGVCSIECQKALGDDVSSVGTVMFVTREERAKIMKAREKKAHPKRKISVEGYRGRA